MLTQKQILIFIKQILFPFLFIFIVVYPTLAQKITFNRVSNPEGVHLQIINSITQDNYGYMWFAVFNSGLWRYDGYQFRNYRHIPGDTTSLASNGIETIYTDSKGMIWIASQASGLDRLDPATGIVSHFRSNKNDLKSLVSDSITSVVEDQDGSIWVGTMEGLNRLDQKTGFFTRYQNDPNDSTSLSNNQVSVLYKDRQGRVWIGTGRGKQNNNKTPGQTGGLNLFNRNTEKFVRYMHNSNDPRSLINNRIGALLEDSKDNFWVNTAGDGLHKMDRENGIVERLPYDPKHPEKLSSSPSKKGDHFDLNLFFIREDGTGALWIGSSGKTITRYDPTTKSSTHFNSFNNDHTSPSKISDAYVSREGVLWMTTWNGRIFRVDPFKNNIPHFDTKSIVNAIYEDHSGELWLGTFGDGLLRINRTKNKITRITNTPSGPFNENNYNISTIYEGSDSTIWIGSFKGLYSYNRKLNVFKHFIHGIQNKNRLWNLAIFDILEDQPGSLWMAGNEGLYHLDIKKGKFTHRRRDLTSTLLKDHAGNLWIDDPHDGILNVLDPLTKKFRHYSCGKGTICCIIEDYKNIIWVGTSRGLYRSNAAVDSFLLVTDPGASITEATLIPGIAEDDQKNIWISSSAGIFKFDSSRKQISVFSKNQGVDPANLNFPGMLGKKGRKGEIFFADNTGYYAFFPDQYKINPIAPQIVVSDFRLAYNEPIKPGKKSPLSKPILQTEEIHLRYNQNDFSFHIKAIHYGSPDDNRVLFMLEGLDKNWRKAGIEKTADYYNVPPKRYIFRIRAATRDGIWTEKTIRVIIYPPWWNTWWFKIAAVLTVATLLYSFIRWRIHQKFSLQLERAGKEKQLAEMRQKTAELQQQATELEMQALRAQMNPHFIFNSLNSINVFILENNKTQASDYLSKFSRLVRLILQNSQEAFISLDRELEALRLYLELESLRFEQKFEYKISIDKNVDTTIIKVPPLIIQPYAENAIWHGLMHLPDGGHGKKEKGNLEIELFLKEEILFCKITDDGIGRKKAAELKSKSALTYKSMGMKITADRIAILQQQEQTNSFVSVTDVVLADGQPAGTEVLIKVPFHHD